VHLAGKKYFQDQYIFSVYGKPVVEWFQQLGLGKTEVSSDRRLPWSLWSAPEEGIRGFLRGLFATDGSAFRPADRTGVRVGLYSVSPGFLQDIQLLLLQYGIFSRIQAPPTTRPQGVWLLLLATGLDVLRFRQFIGFANTRKQSLLDSYQYNSRGAKPFRPQVTSILAVGAHHVGDVSMPQSPTFIVGGIRVHNCFACAKTRDAVDTLRAKKGLSFRDAIRELEKLYKLPHLDWDSHTPQPSQTEDIKAKLEGSKNETFAEHLERLQTSLSWVTTERVLEMNRTLAYWEALDQIAHKVDKALLPEDQGRQILAELRTRLDMELQGKK